MHEQLGIRLSYWAHRGWVVNVHLTDELSGAKWHWVSPGDFEDVGTRAMEASEVLDVFADWGASYLHVALQGWHYVRDVESSSAVSAAAVGALEQQ
jgi:hypothetical protein